MSGLLKKIVFLFGISLFLFFSACAHIEEEPSPQKEPTPEKESVLQKEPALEKEPAVERYDTVKIAQKYLAEGDFQKAIEIYHDAYNKNPDDITLRSNYIKTIDHVKKNADITFNREDFALAGSMYRVLLNNYANIKDFISSASCDRDFLSSRINTCSKILTERGLVEYRKGNLKEAISIWKPILSFDSENGEVKKAIETATTQLKNLQK